MRGRINSSVGFPPELPSSAGYAPVTTVFDSAQAVGAANQYLNDPVLLRQLTDRVYELLKLDLQWQRERVQGYGRGRG
jgi:hypothetical protein